MNSQKKNILIVCSNDDRYLFTNYLSTFNCTYKESLSKLRNCLKQKSFESLILFCEINCTKDEEMVLKYLNECFPNMNSIAILKRNEIKISHFLGKNGINEVLTTIELDKLASLFHSSTGNKITLDKLKISLEGLSLLAKKILCFIM